MSAYMLLNSMLIDPEDHSKEVREILDLANGVVDRFFDDLRASPATREPPDIQALLMSFDKVSLGIPGAITAAHLSATSTGKIGKFVLLPELTREQAVHVFTFEETEMRILMVSLLIHLRQIEDEGTSGEVERLLENTQERFKHFLGYCLTASQAN